MKRLLLILLIVPLTLTAKETDFLCSFELSEQKGFDEGVRKKQEYSYTYNDEPDEDGKTHLEGYFSYECETEPDAISCFYTTKRFGIDKPNHGMKLSADGSRLSFVMSTVRINRLNLSASYFVSKDSYDSQVFGKLKSYPNPDDYYKELKAYSETAYFEGSCKVIKQEDLKF